jgi:hypothetical protein
MPSHTEFATKSREDLTVNLRQAKEIHVAAIGVLRTLTTLAVPVSVAALPASDRWLPAVDQAITHGFDFCNQLVERQYDYIVNAVDRAASN